MTTTPASILQKISGRYPGAWSLFDQFRADRGTKGLPDWPAWCYCPMAGAYRVVSGGGPQRLLPAQAMQDISAVSAMAAWRVTKGVYRFDRDLSPALTSTPLTGDIPADVLYRLPEWCLYLETPGLPWMSTSLRGAWVHLEWDVNDGRTELRLLLDCIDDRLIPVPLHLGEWSVMEAVERLSKEAHRNATSLLGLDGPLVTPDDLREISKGVTPLISLVLYLCADEPEINDRLFPGMRPGFPQPKKTKKGLRLFEAEKVRVWDVGTSLGQSIRQAREARAEQKERGTHASPEPHVRRAHWHGFWSGPMAGPRKFSYKWIPPLIVGA